MHLYLNYKNVGWSGSTFHDLLWVNENAYYNPYDLQKKVMENIYKNDLEVVDYLCNVPEQWTRHTFNPHMCCECDHNSPFWGIIQCMHQALQRSISDDFVQR